MYSIGERLKRLRIQKNLTQEELGERTDLSKGYISQVERDLASPSMETFFNILQVLGCAPKDLIKLVMKKLMKDINLHGWFQNQMRKRWNHLY